MPKTYREITTSFLYGPPIMVPDWVDGSTSPKDAFTQGVELAKSTLKKMIDDERGIEPPPSR